MTVPGPADGYGLRRRARAAAVGPCAWSRPAGGPGLEAGVANSPGAVLPAPAGSSDAASPATRRPGVVPPSATEDRDRPARVALVDSPRPANSAMLHRARPLFLARRSPGPGQ